MYTSKPSMPVCKVSKFSLTISFILELCASLSYSAGPELTALPTTAVYGLNYPSTSFDQLTPASFSTSHSYYRVYDDTANSGTLPHYSEADVSGAMDFTYFGDTGLSFTNSFQSSVTKVSHGADGSSDLAGTIANFSVHLSGPTRVQTVTDLSGSFATNLAGGG